MLSIPWLFKNSSYYWHIYLESFLLLLNFYFYSFSLFSLRCLIVRSDIQMSVVLIYYQVSKVALRIWAIVRHRQSMKMYYMVYHIIYSYYFHIGSQWLFWAIRNGKKVNYSLFLCIYLSFLLVTYFTFWITLTVPIE